MKKIVKWDFISRISLLDHPRLKVVEDTVRLPDGTITHYVRQPPVSHHSVAVIAVNENGEILLQQEYSYPPNAVLWQLPGGGMQEGETPQEAAVRELSKESGFTADEVKLVGYSFTNNRRSDHKQYVVLCKALRRQSLKGDPEEFIHSQWVRLKDIHDMIAHDKIHNMGLLAALHLWLHSDVDPPQKIGR